MEILALESVGASAGRWLGMFIAVTVGLVGMAKCIDLARRPTTNTLCALSLAVLLGSWGLSALVRMLGTAGDLPELVVRILMVNCSGLSLASPVLAIVGLVQYRNNRERYRQGRAQAIWALSLSLVMLVVGGALVAAQIAHRKRVAERAGPATYVTRGRVHRFPDFNFRFEAPGSPWHQSDYQSTDEDMKLGYTRDYPPIGVSVRAELSGVELAISNQDLADQARRFWLQKGTEFELIKEVPHTVNGVPGVLVVARLPTGGGLLHMVIWMSSHRGFVFRICAAGPVENAHEVDAIAERILPRFHTIDPHTVVHSSGMEPLQEFHSPEFGISLLFPDAGWRREDALRQKHPDAILGAAHGRHVALAVMPLAWPVGVPEPDAEDLVSAVVVGLKAEFGSAFDPEVRPIHHRGVSGHEIRFERETPIGTYLYLFRILRRGSVVYLLQGWVDVTTPSEMGRVERTLDAVAFSGPPLHRVPCAVGKPSPELANLLHRVGALAEEEGRSEDAAAYYAASGPADPTSEENLVRALSSLNVLAQFEEAAGLLAECSSKLEESLILRSWRAYLLYQTGAVEEAASVFDALFDEGHEDEEDLKIYVELLTESGRAQDAVRVLSRFLEQRESIRARRWLGNVHAKEGRHEAAIKIFEQLQTEHPDDPEVAAALVRGYLDAGLPRRAISTAERLIASGLSTSSLYYLKGKSEVALERFEAAKASLEAGLRLEPGSELLREALCLVSARLGEGENSSVKEPIAPVELPEELRHRLDEIWKSSQVRTGAHATRYRYELKALEFRPGERLRTTSYRFIELADANAVQAATTQGYLFDPVVERVFVNRLIVRNAGGEIIGRGDPSEYFVEQYGAPGEATDLRVLNLPVAGLRPGCRIELVLTRETRAPPERFPFRFFLLATAQPTGCAGVLVRGDLDQLAHRVTGNPAHGRIGDALYWLQADPPTLRQGPLQADVTTYAPALWLVDRDATWDGVALRYLDRIADRFVSCEAVSRLAGELVAGKQDREAKLKAIARYVQREFTYRAIAFGHRTHVPEPVEQTILRRWGDCKDHTLLLHLLLREAGIESHPALVKAVGCVRMDSPSLDQFDHMILYLPREDRFIDATDKYSDVLAAVPWGLPDREALILDSTAPRFERIPAYASGSTTVHSERTIRLAFSSASDAAIAAVVTENLTCTGYLAGLMRAWISALAEPDRADAALEWLGSSLEIRMRSFELRGLEQPEDPLVLVMEYEIQDTFRASEGILVGSAPCLWEQWFLRVEPVEERRTPFENRLPLVVSTDMRLVAPFGYQHSLPSKSEFEGESPFEVWRYRWQVEDGTLRLRYRVRKRTGRFPADRYDRYCRSRAEAARVLRQTLVLKKP